MKHCTLCGTAKPLDGFYRDKTRTDGRFPQCKACVSRAAKERYAKDPAPAKARALRNHSPVAATASRKRWRERNPDAARATSRAWKQNNREAWRAQKRRNAKRSRLGRDAVSVAYADILSLDPCSYCGSPSDTVDHIDPSARGGKSDWSNLTAACRSCNSSKNDRPLLVFLANQKELV